jgi:hypothetical protein
MIDFTVTPSMLIDNLRNGYSQLLYSIEVLQNHISIYLLVVIREDKIS